MKWGLLSYGRIAQKFVENLQYLDPAKLGAIASASNIEKANHDHPDIACYTNYTELVKNEDIDCVYVSSTHNLHKAQTILALEHGKHVLCEKPLSTNFQDAVEMFNCAESNGCLLMEAMWTRFLPAYQVMKSKITSGEIGDVQLVQADFGFASDLSNTQGRLLNPMLAGGSIYDVGIYPIALAIDIFGEEPEEIIAKGTLSDSNIDLSSAVQMHFSSNRIAQLFSSISLTTTHRAIISGTKGRIVLPLFWKGQELIVEKGMDARSFSHPFECSGFVHEIKAFENSISQRDTFNPIMHKNDSLMISRTIDRIYAQIRN